jgi:DNA transposition AAA+ family ATPase
VSMLESGGATRLFLEDLMKACGISERKSYGEMKQRAFRYFDPQTLLIVDEFHQTLIGRTIKMASIETIRAIYEKCGCGVVLCGTDIVPDMFEDARFKKFLGQTANRGVLRRLIPATPYREDVTALCKAYGLGVADGEAKALVNTIASTNGIGKLCKFMAMSRRLAAKRRTPVTWDHFLETHATLKSWERGEQMKREAK